MTDTEWAQSTDPRAMLDVVQGSDRKLQLWADACYAKCSCTQKDRTLDIRTVSFWRNSGAVLTCACTQACQADFLRDIFGNPWRGISRMPDGTHFHMTPSPYETRRVPVEDWLTWHDGTVVKLAERIYDEAGRECEKCKGKGWEHWGHPLPSGGFECSCDVCHGTGRLGVELDAGLMAILADALEEAGCTDAAILDHCRGREPCQKCDGAGYRCPKPRGVPRGAHPMVPVDEGWPCEACQGAGFRPALHVRGCWVLDLLLGKE